MWKEQIKLLTPRYAFSSPATQDEIAIAERKLDICFPDDLGELLLESNGVEGEYELGLVWSLERIVTENLHFRSSNDFTDLYMPFNALLFFADAGNGDQFAFPILQAICNDNVFVWNHENDSRQWVAPSLSKYLEWWLNGSLKI